MAFYGFVCSRGHHSTLQFPMTAVPGAVACECGAAAMRDFVGDVRTLRVVTDDPIRRAWLSDSFGHAMAEQAREPDPLMPHDKFEARDRLRTHGRIYVGDDHSKLDPKGRASIEKAKRNGGLV